GAKVFKKESKTRQEMSSQRSIRHFFSASPKKTKQEKIKNEDKEKAIEENDKTGDKSLTAVRPEGPATALVQTNDKPIQLAMSIKKESDSEDSPIKKRKSAKRNKIESDSEEENEETSQPSPVKKLKVEENGNNAKVDKASKKVKKPAAKEKQKKEEAKSLDKSELIAKMEKDESVSQDTTKKSANITPFFQPKGKAPSTSNAKVKPEVYSPSKSPYHPINDACWTRDEKVPYLAFARTLELVEATSSRLKSIEIVANFLRSLVVLSPDDIVPALRMCINQLAPAYTGLELGLGDGALMKAVAQTTGRSVAQVRADVSVLGDLGLVAEASRGKQKTMFQPPPLTLRGVFQQLLDVANMQGGTAMTRKTDKVQSLLVACKFSEARFLIRSLTGKLRVGLAELSLLQALAQAIVLTPPCQSYPPSVLDSSKGKYDNVKSKVEEVATNIKVAYYQCPSYEKVVSELLKEGAEGIVDRCPITLGLPVKPMLACPSTGVSDVMVKFGSNKFTCEYKYDGERAQIHILPDGKVKVFSRNQEDMSGKYPEVASRAKTWLKPDVTSAILDAEAVAWDVEKKILLPFQVLSTRKRKDVNEADIKVQVCIFAFDLLQIDGEPIVDKPLRIRRGLMKEKLQLVEGQLQFATSIDPETPEEIEEFMENAVKGHCEGLMVKTLDENATYAIARRSQRWLKLKKDYMEGVGDTLDLVVVGGYLGKGRRTGVYGGFLLACFDAESEEYQTICKIGTGFSDEDLQSHSTKLKEHLLPRAPSYYRYESGSEPDHWFSPVLLWEVKCADLSLSPVHKAAIGLVDSEKGISLRFPRFIRTRDDKGPELATSASQVASMYLNQDQIKGAAIPKGEEEGFY
ncbi:hypothetical protein QYM36_014211, partial [Artemia franciscana]